MSEPFGSYQLDRLLGRGGMAEAFVAYHSGRGGGPPLVLKRIRADFAEDEEYLRRFVLEAQVASRLKHRNLARFKEFGRVGDCHYLVMDMVHGHSLHRLLDPIFRNDAPPPLSVALTIGAGVLDGLAVMHAVTDEQGHARPMLHRDVTPSNVIVSDEGHSVIIDFGITKDVMGPSITLPGKVIGTARYMSPEHRKAEYIDPRADVFSASVILFELLTGQHPWPPLSTMKELLRVTFDPPQIISEAGVAVPSKIMDVVLRGLANDPTDRYTDAAHMARALRASAKKCEVGLSVNEEVTQWVDTLGLLIDEDLSQPVLDLANSGGEAEVMWTSSGGLSTGELSPEDPTLSPSEALSIPPLPPRREAALPADSDLDDHIDAALGGFSLAKAVVIGAGLATALALIWFVIQG